jgi:hypothetical protein
MTPTPATFTALSPAGESAESGVLANALGGINTALSKKYLSTKPSLAHILPTHAQPRFL